MASAAFLPWHWVIENLADLKQADTSLLRASVAKVPNFSTSAPESLRERVTLRYLEEIAGPCGAADAPSTSGSGRGLEVTRSSEEVLCSHLRKAKSLCSLERDGAERFSHDLHEFILHKRAALAKSSLELLKESILEGRSQAASSLKEHSGLFGPTQVDYIHRNSGSDFERKQQLKLRTNDNGTVLRIQGQHSECDRRSQLHGDIVSSGGNNVQLLKLSSPHQPSCKEKVSLQHAPVIGNKKNVGRPLCENDHFDGGLSVLRETPTDGGGSDGMHSSFDPNDEIFNAEKRLWSAKVLGNQDSIAGDWTEQGLCIKCGRGGQLLSCSVSGCLLAVHENCLGTLVNFKGKGLFYCPFCSYNRALTAYCKARKNVSRAKKALSAYIGRDLVQEHLTELPPARVLRETSPSGAIGTENQPCIHSHQYHGDEPSESFLNSKEHQQKQVDNVCNKGHPSSRHVEASLSVGGRDVSRNSEEMNQDEMATHHQDTSQVQRCQLRDASNFMNNDKLPCDDKVTSHMRENADAIIEDGEVGNDCECIRVAEHQQLAKPHTTTDAGSLLHEEANVYQIRDEEKDGISLANNLKLENQEQVKAAPDRADRETLTSKPNERRAKRGRQDALLDKIHYHQENNENPNGEKSSSGCCSKRVIQPKRYSSPKVSLGRRTNVYWTSEEEEALKDAMKKYAVDGDGNLPWKRIWEFGRHKFHPSRQPGDLRDKWRNIRDKKSSKRRNVI